MALHCASRLEVLNYLYKKRNQIAYSIGLIAEIPIAMCNSDYDFDKGLTIETQQEDSRVPVGLLQAHEINLFLVTTSSQLTAQLYVISNTKYLIFSITLKDTYLHSVFHPPSQHC
ncbi:MAG: hypothetical protein HOP37_14355 [Cyclobacteriaceae bacterium]|nr:hypothetical protein [Cyclobacteriaceae bacterium]